MSWQEEAQKRIDADNAKRISENSQGPFLKLKEGITTILVDLDKGEPAIVEGKFGQKRRIEIIEPKIEGKRPKLDMSVKLYEQFVKAIQGKAGKVQVVISRNGQMKDTRYNVSVV